MDFLICCDGVSPCVRAATAQIGQVMMRLVPYKTNISWRKGAGATAYLLGRLSCIRGGKFSAARVVSNNTGNEYDNGGSPGLVCQSHLNQVNWHILWKPSRLGCCKCSGDTVRRNTIECSFESRSPLGCLAVKPREIAATLATRIVRRID